MTLSADTLWSQKQPTATAKEIVVPVGQTWIVRDVRAFTEQTNGYHAISVVNSTGTVVVPIIRIVATVTNQTAVVEDGFIVLEAGDKLVSQAPVGGFYWWISGHRFFV